MDLKLWLVFEGKTKELTIELTDEAIDAVVKICEAFGIAYHLTEKEMM